MTYNLSNDVWIFLSSLKYWMCITSEPLGGKHLILIDSPLAYTGSKGLRSINGDWGISAKKKRHFSCISYVFYAMQIILIQQSYRQWMERRCTSWTTTPVTWEFGTPFLVNSGFPRPPPIRLWSLLFMCNPTTFKWTKSPLNPLKKKIHTFNSEWDR